MAFDSINPANGEHFATVSAMEPAQLDAALEAALRAQRSWRETRVEERAAPMRRAAQLLRDQADELATLMAREMGKVHQDGVAEVQKCASACEHFAAHAPQYLATRTEPSDAARSEVRFEPLGVVLAIMPWNFPLWQVFRFLAPNLMAGNGGVLKHASNVPQCAMAIETLLRDAGFPVDLFRTLLIGSAEVPAVIGDPRVAAVTLTGSEAAGRDVAQHAGRALKPLVLELGGSDAFIVLADADLDEAARTAAKARCINAGQSCIAAKRFIVERAVYEPFLERFVAAMRAVRMGDPLDPASDIGPQARHDLRDALHAQVRQAIGEGARCVLGGEIPAQLGAYYPPTVLVEVAPGSIAYREEIFGPVAAVIAAQDAEDAVRIANDTKFGLGASLWTADPARAERLVGRIEAGAVFVNGMVRSDPRLPFGGIKASGFGRELSLEGARAFCNAKTVWVR